MDKPNEAEYGALLLTDANDPGAKSRETGNDSYFIADCLVCDLTALSNFSSSNRFVLLSSKVTY